MLSTHSFNALLKTLEEPPPHVKFLLATTDPQKLPVTVLSRCLQFNLKRLPVALISEHLARCSTAEKISVRSRRRCGSWRRPPTAACATRCRCSISSSPSAAARWTRPARAACSAPSIAITSRDSRARSPPAMPRSCSRPRAALEEFSPDYGQVLDDLAALLTRVALRQLVPGYEGDELFDPRAADGTGRRDLRRRRAALLPDRHSRPARSAVRAGSAHRFRDDAGAHAGVPPGGQRRAAAQLPAAARCAPAGAGALPSTGGSPIVRPASAGPDRPGAVGARHRRSRHHRRGAPARDQLRAGRTQRQHAAPRARSRKVSALNTAGKSRTPRAGAGEISRRPREARVRRRRARRSRRRRRPANAARPKRSTRRAARSRKIPRCAK